jgi:hypothetical protein
MRHTSLINGYYSNSYQVAVNPGLDYYASYYANGNPVLIVMQLSGTPTMTMTLRINGTQVASQVFNQPNPILTSQMNICGWSGDTGRSYYGSMGEIAWWVPGATNVSLSDVQRIEGYLANKWWGVGAANTLPADHPYKTTSP